jgi:hypothetical protein
MMQSEPNSTQSATEFAWFVASRWQEYEGEARVNALRVVSVALFYAVEVAAYYGGGAGLLGSARPEALTPKLHSAITVVAAGWFFLGLGVHVCLTRRVFPGALKYVVTVVDIALLQLVLMFGSGARSPMVAAYFVLIALASMRFSLGLVRCATVIAMISYLAVNGYARWYAAPAVRPLISVPRFDQALVLLAMAMTGIVLGQLIRRVRAMSVDYAARVHGN